MTFEELCVKIFFSPRDPNSTHGLTNVYQYADRFRPVCTENNRQAGRSEVQAGPSFEPLSSLEMSDPAGYEPRDGPPSVQRGPAWIERESQKNVRSDTCDTHHLQADKAMD